MAPEALASFSPIPSGITTDHQTPRRGSLVGVEPVAQIVMMEDHDGAYYAWKRAGLKGRILVHIDAHLDWDWIADKNPLDLLQAHSLSQVDSMLKERFLWNLSRRTNEELVHIGNYVDPALQQGVVKEFYWVVPDSFMQNPVRYRNLVRMFQRKVKENPGEFTILTLENRRIVAEVHGKRLTTCSLLDLPRIEDPVLLDIDTDFLLPGPAEDCRSGHDLWKQVPWIWPEDLIRRLKHKGVRTSFVTIAYSVEGGFTAAGYKYLGDALASYLKHPEPPERLREVMAHKRRAAIYRHANQLDHAIAEYEEALQLTPEDASSHFNVAYLYDEVGSLARASAEYKEAIRLDPTYATAYNNMGPVYYSFGMLEHAWWEYQRILRWDIENPDAHYGLAELLARQQRWEEAIRCYQTVLNLRLGDAGAERGLGYSYMRQGRWDEAIVHWERAITAQPRKAAWHFWLGHCYARRKRWDEAIDAYRQALGCGMRNATLYMTLGRLYLRKRKFYKAWKQYRKGLRLWARSVPFSMKKAWGRLCRPLARRFSRG